MAKTTYQVFVERDGSFGVELSQMGAMVRTATGFASKRSAQDWIAQDTQLHNVDNPFREQAEHTPRSRE
mgnify:CR=1 FL=1